MEIIAEKAIRVRYNCQLLKNYVLAENPGHIWFQEYLLDY
jgi:hypothetical protein